MRPHKDAHGDPWPHPCPLCDRAEHVWTEWGAPCQCCGAPRPLTELTEEPDDHDRDP